MDARERYRAVAVRSDDWWAIEVVSGLPPNMLALTQARTRGEVEDMARHAVADLLEIDATGVDMSVAFQSGSDATSDIRVAGVRSLSRDQPTLGKHPDRQPRDDN